MTRLRSLPAAGPPSKYARFLGGIQALLSEARRGAARAINGILKATYWEIGRRIVQHEQGGSPRADYGQALLSKLADDLTRRMGRGFSKRNLEQMRAFHLQWPIAQTVSAQSGTTGWQTVAARLRLSWSHYVRLIALRTDLARPCAGGAAGSAFPGYYASLRAVFPDRRGIRSRNLKYMRVLAGARPDRAIVQRPVAQLPWRHNIALLEQWRDAKPRPWYAQEAPFP